MLHTIMLHIVKLTRFWVLVLITGIFLSRENVNRKKKLKKKNGGLKELMKLPKKPKMSLRLDWSCLT